MAIAGIGIDLVDIRRFKTLMTRRGASFLNHVFTRGEVRYARTRARPEEHYAARFAAKEAVMKAMKTGWSRGVSWHDIEIVRSPSGSVEARLSGGAEKTMKRLKIRRMHLSLTHTGSHAAAFAIAEKTKQK